MLKFKVKPGSGTSTVRRKTKPRGSSRGALFVVSMLLISSAVLRIGAEAGRAVAREPADTEMANATDPGAQLCKTPDDLRALLGLFQNREARIKEREAQLADRLQALAVADREISTKLAALTTAEADLRKTLALADEAAEGDLAKLTSVYENMKPKNAAALFEEMAPEFAAGFLGRMRPEAAAGIMAGLSPTAAYTISVVLAGRNADVPKN